jgi:guanine deaminase
MARDLGGRAILADAFHAPRLGVVEHLPGALIEIDADGVIAAVTTEADEAHAERVRALRREGRLETLTAGSFLTPGFVDLHVHAPQYPQLGRALDAPLEVWLQTYTFPLEARYRDLAFARRAYRALVEDLLANGTTTALYHATIHEDATRLLVDICLEAGQRAVIGKVAMDHPESCPDFYRDASVDAAIAGTRAVIDHIRTHPDNRDRRVEPVVTPRFIPACTDPLLEALGALAKDCGCRVQTHCSESDWEHGHVLERIGRRDAEALDGFGLLRPHSVMAHATLLPPQDMDLLRDRQTAVAHCPLSNAYFGDAVFPLRAALQKGLRVGLGTDISGGPSASMFEAQRWAIAASRMLEAGVEPDLPRDLRSKRAGARIDFRDAFFLATRGGGEALGLPIGLFREGCAFDAIEIDPAAPAGGIRLIDGPDEGEALLQKSLFTATRANIARTWVAGLVVSGGEPGPTPEAA